LVERVVNERSARDRIDEQAQSPDIKALLRQRTDNAISRGVFGVPSMEV
jgi:2-hydroxychromene-2-carboxylate isomerase